MCRAISLVASGRGSRVASPRPRRLNLYVESSDSMLSLTRSLEKAYDSPPEGMMKWQGRPALIQESCVETLPLVLFPIFLNGVDQKLAQQSELCNESAHIVLLRLRVRDGGGPWTPR